MLLREIPTVLRHESYAVPALLGAGVLVAAQEAGSDNPGFPVLGVAVRLAGLRFGVHIPIAPSERDGSRGEVGRHGGSGCLLGEADEDRAAVAPAEGYVGSHAGRSARVPVQTDLGPITIDGAERWFEYQDGDERRRLAFHDYAAIYAVPGLYERVFYGELGMCSAEVVVRAWAETLERLGRDPKEERVLDVGAGNGIGGERIRELGVAQLIGTDIEPQAAIAAERDRPGVYDDYLTGDLDDEDLLGTLAFTSVLALSAVGVGHLPAATLERTLSRLEPGGLFAFAVTPALLPGSEDPDGRATGYPDTLERLLAGELARVEYVHRRQADGTPHDAVALVGRV